MWRFSSLFVLSAMRQNGDSNDMIAENLFYVAIFLAEAVTARLYFNYIYKQTKSRTCVFFSFALGYTLLFLASQLDAVLVNVALFLIVNAVILALNYSCERVSALMHATFLTLMMSISEILVNLLLTYKTNDYTAYTYSLSAFMPLFVFSKLLYFLITVVASRLFRPHKNISNEPSQIVRLCVMPIVSVIIVVTFIYIGSVGELTKLTEILVSISVIALLLVNIVVLSIYNRIQKIDEEYAALQIGQLKDQSDAEYYEMLQQQYDNQRILIHDIQRHFSVIGMMAEDGETRKIREYISALEDMPEFKRKVRLCDEPILNMILLRYSEYCAANGISFLCDVRADCVSFMDAASITALFGNLLSNAVEAAERSQEKIVEFSITKNAQQNSVLISAVNSCDIVPVKGTDGNFETSKSKAKGHGYGTKSIARVILKYGGEYDMRYDDSTREFHSVICFPLG